MNGRTQDARDIEHGDLRLGTGDEPPIAAHLVTPRTLYTHHGIYVGNGCVIHYAGFAYGLRRGPVEQVSLERFAHGRAVEIRPDQRRFDRGEVVERARSRLGESHYRILTNNCEHFCGWALRGECFSAQVERIRAAPRLACRAAGLLWNRIGRALRGAAAAIQFSPRLPDRQSVMHASMKFLVALTSFAVMAAVVSFDADSAEQREQDRYTDMSQPNPIASPSLSAGKFSAFDRDVIWLNSRPLGAADLRGKVVLVDFWTYTCINWRRTLPWLRAWAEKYRDSGLVVIGVHTPEFGFEAQIDNIRQAVREQNVAYPVAVDSSYSIWDDFGNKFWPAVYLLDEQGRVRDRKFGEGGYEQLEMSIQRLLAESGRRPFDGRPVAVKASGAEIEADWRNLQSPETYVGSSHGGNFASVRTVFADRSRVYAYPSHLRLNEWALAGSWTVNPDSAVLRAARGKVVFRFHARDLHMVMGPAARGTSVPFRVTIDGKPPGAAHGIDTDAEGRGTVDSQRMYQLIRQPRPIGDRQFEIEFLEPGVELFVFTFG